MTIVCFCITMCYLATVIAFQTYCENKQPPKPRHRRHDLLSSKEDPIE